MTANFPLDYQLLNLQVWASGTGQSSSGPWQTVGHLLSTPNKVVNWGPPFTGFSFPTVVSEIFSALNLITFIHNSVLSVYVQLCKEEGKSAPVPALRKHEYQKKKSVMTDCYPKGRKCSQPQEKKTIEIQVLRAHTESVAGWIMALREVHMPTPVTYEYHFTSLQICLN